LDKNVIANYLYVPSQNGNVKNYNQEFGWFYKSRTTDKWYRYEENEEMQLETSYKQRNEEELRFSLRGVNYLISFKTWTQQALNERDEGRQIKRDFVHEPRIIKSVRSNAEMEQKQRIPVLVLAAFLIVSAIIVQWYFYENTK
jgi:hypothetical protein